MITKNLVKYIHSLNLKKHRDAQHCFVAEGPKVITDLLPLIPCKALYATEDFLQAANPNLLRKAKLVETVKQADLERLSLLRSPRGGIAIFEIPSCEAEADKSMASLPLNNLCLALDGIQDPGNLGTIIRIADWFGIEHIFASLDTADAYAPKVIQATMGAIGRVHIHYVDLPKFLKCLDLNTPVFGTFLDGSNIYQQILTKTGIIVMGNEGNGISPAVAQCVTHKLLIPNFPEDRLTSESLNVAVATAIVCAEFRRG